MELSKILKTFYRLLSGEKSKDHVASISSYHRVQASKEYDLALEYLRNHLEIWGYEVIVHEYPADGSTLYSDGWPARIGWSLYEGELKIIKPHEYVVCNTNESPLAVVVHSRAIDEFETEVIDVGRGVSDNDYKTDVEGKLVLASGPTRPVHYMAVERRGALGILFYDEKIERYTRRYRALWPYYNEIDKIGVMFSLSLNEATRLRSLLRRGQVIARGFVKSEFYKSSLKILEAYLPGKSSDEFMLLVAHLCHPKPGAHDNASGSGLLLEIARVFKMAVDRGDISLEKGLKLIWVPEFYGTIAYIESHKRELENVLGVLNLDMVGAYQDKTGGVINVIGVPPFSQSALPLLAYNILSRSIELLRREKGYVIKYSYGKYSGGSDHHVFVDPILSIPATAYIQWPDKFWHTDADSIDNIDPLILKAVGVAASTLSTLILTVKDNVDLTKLAHMTTNSALSLLADLSTRYENITPEKLRYMGELYRRAILSLLRLSKEICTEEVIERYSSRLIAHVNLLIDSLQEVSKKTITKEVHDGRVFRRTKKVPLNISEVLRTLPYERALFWYEVQDVRDLAGLLYYMLDGRKTVSDIFKELKYYLDNVNVDMFNKILEDLEISGWIEKLS